MDDFPEDVPTLRGKALGSFLVIVKLGVSESVPLNPMVNDHIIPIKWLFHWEYTLFSDKPNCCLFLGDICLSTLIHVCSHYVCDIQGYVYIYIYRERERTRGIHGEVLLQVPEPFKLPNHC